jgi:catechol 2,3-dioxygenase-like lactoylglutathione lyase family enzyme
MKLKSIYSIISTDSLNEARDFYIRYFGFEVVFDTGWYVHLHSQRDGSDVPLELGFMRPNNAMLPSTLHAAYNGDGVYISIEADDVDTVYEQLLEDGYTAVLELCDEAWGQRHFIIRDPSGCLLDVVKPIPPTDEYKAAAVIPKT